MLISCDSGHEYYQSPNDHIQGHGCSVCSKQMHESKAEKDMFDYISSLTDLEVLPNVRSIIAPYELDIYIPDLNLAIEFNGTYWHSEKFKDKNYHINKHKACVSKGIRLVQIWEYDWNDKPNLCRSFLKSLIVQPIRIYARKLKIKEIPLDEQRIFLDKYHFQGYTASSICIGLYDDDVLIQLMSLKKLNSMGSYEIGRLCTLSGYAVVGGSSKLFKSLTSGLYYTSIISYNNMDKFNGHVYNKLGMKLEKSYIISYFYTNGKEIFSRQKFQKHKLVSLGYDSDKTEHDITNSMGLYRVYPTGNSKYIMTCQKNS